MFRDSQPLEPKRIHEIWAEWGSSKIEIIFLDFPLLKEGEVEWDRDAFKKMENLKTLIIKNCVFSKGPKHLPNTLRVLEWWRYPSQDLPYDFHPKKLAICKLPKSCVTSLGLAAFFSKKKFVNLTSLNFGMCQYLTQIRDVSCLQHLEKLSFRRCENLFTIHCSVGLLEKLKILDASRCFSLVSFPPLKLTSLEQLKLNGCISLESFPEILGKMENILKLNLQGTSIEEIPLSFRNLTRLQKLRLSYSYRPLTICRNATMMPELAEIEAHHGDGWVLPKEDEGAEKVSLAVSSNVQRLCLKRCNLSDEFFSIFLPYFANVKELSLAENNFTVIPECIKECHFLTWLILDDCERLQEIRRFPPNLKYFSAKGCLSLTSSCRSMLLSQELHEAGNTFLLPEAMIPEWFEFQTWAPSISFWFRHKFPAVAICLVAGPAWNDSPQFRRKFELMLIINSNKVCRRFLMETNCTCLSDSREIELAPNLDEWNDSPQIKLEDYLDEALLENDWNHAKLLCEHLDFVPVFTKWGIHVWKQQSSMEDIRFTNPCRKRKFDDFNDSESQNQPLRKKQRLMNMEVAET